MKFTDTFERHELEAPHALYVGTLPTELLAGMSPFDSIWTMHPDEFHEIQIHGRLVRTPRWQQAYGRDYHYTGRVNRALPLPPEIAPLLAWTQDAIDTRLNGVLLNWYDGSLGHYIGAHRDSTANLLNGSPIVTISFGEERIFRIRSWKSHAFKRDFAVRSGSVIVMPYETNLVFTHEVPASRQARGRRISVTCRAFGD